MLKKHLILFGIIASSILLIIAAIVYPGGSQADSNSIGYDLQNNYLCNLFSEKAVNGEISNSRYFAIPGMFFLCSSFAIFFVRISHKIATGTPALIIKYCGIASAIFAFMVATPYHDLMTTIACVFAMLSLFYITVFIFRTRMTIFKILSTVSLSFLYLNAFIYYSQVMIVWLPILQKASWLLVMMLFLGLEYFTTREDFAEANGRASVR